MFEDFQLIIPMSGLGKRFVNKGYEHPKPLIEVDGFPMIQLVLELFPNIEDITFICNSYHEKNFDIVNKLKNIRPESKIHIVNYDEIKGPVSSIDKISNKIDNYKKTIVSYCDYGGVWDFNNFLEITNSKNIDGIIPCYTGFHPHMLGKDNYAFVKTENGVVTKVQEKKPFTDNKMNELASNGTYYFRTGELMKKYFTKLIESDETINGEFYVSMVYNKMIEDNLKVVTFPIKKMLQWGTPYDLESYNMWSNYFRKIIDKGSIFDITYKNVTTIIPMAGKGSRFYDEGYDTPKPLIPINNKPMVVQAVNALPKTDKYVFVCLNSQIEKNNLNDVLRINFPNSEIVVIDETTEGQACTCQIAIDTEGISDDDSIIISACDNSVIYDKNKFDEYISDENNDVIVWSFRKNPTSSINPNMYAWLDVDEQDFIKYVSCKNFIYDNPLETHAIIGTMFFRKAKFFSENFRKNFNSNKRVNNEFYVDDVVNTCIKEGLKVKVFESENYICWGTPNDLKTFLYWQEFFDICDWHPYKKEKDITI